MDRRLPRRLAAAGMVIAGALLMWLSTETLGGAIMMAAGIALEAFGIFRLDRS